MTVTPPEPEWLERLVLATETAIARLRELDDPTHATLLNDLETFHQRLVERL